MATHKQAAKRHRQSLRRRARNKHWRSTIRNAVRQVRSATADGDAPARLANAERLLRRGASKGVLHPKTASRTISRLHKLVHS